MRKIYSYTLTVATALMLMCSCSKDNDTLLPNDGDDQNNNPATNTYLAPRIAASMGGNANTRAVVEENASYKDGEQFRWEQSDEVLVVFTKAGSDDIEIVYNVEEGSIVAADGEQLATCTLVPNAEDDTKLDEGDYTMTLHYPASAWKKFRSSQTLDYTSIAQNGTTSSNINTHQLMKGETSITIGGESAAASVTLSHYASLMRFTVTNDSGNSPFTVKSITLSSESGQFATTHDGTNASGSASSITLSVAEGSFSVDSETNIGTFYGYLPLLPTSNLSGELTAQLTVECDGQEYVGSKVIDAETVAGVFGNGIEVGTSYYFGIKFSDVYSQPTTLQTTASEQVTTENIKKHITPMGQLVIKGSIKATDIANLKAWGESSTEVIALKDLDMSEASLGEGVALPASAFQKNTKLVNVALPTDLREIGEKAFYGCSGLETVTYSNEVTSIGESCFFPCRNLKEIIIPNNESFTTINNYTFNCESITKVAIPQHITTIGDAAFENCINLAEVTFAANSKLESMGVRAFKNCNNLENSPFPLDAPNFTTLAAGVLSGSSSITTLIIPASITVINYNITSEINNANSIIFEGKLGAADGKSESPNPVEGKLAISPSSFYPNFTTKSAYNIFLPNIEDSAIAETYDTVLKASLLGLLVDTTVYYNYNGTEGYANATDADKIDITKYTKYESATE